MPAPWVGGKLVQANKTYFIRFSSTSNSGIICFLLNPHATFFLFSLLDGEL